MQPNLADLMKEAQKMQQKMQEAQAALEKMVVKGEAGAGLVTLEMTGRHDVKFVRIDKSVIDPAEKEMLQDLIAAAINDAVRKVEQETRSKMSKLTQGLNIPPGFQPPESEE